MFTYFDTERRGVIWGVSGPQGFAIHIFHVNINCDVT